MVDDDAIEAFARDGVVVVRGIIGADLIDSLAVDVARALAEPGSRSLVASDDSDPGAFLEDFCRWQELPALQEAALHSVLPELAASLMDSRSARFYHDHILVKEPHTEQRTPWHQDAPYYNVEGRGITAWVTLDKIPKDGSMEFWAGSHRGPLRTPRSFLDNQAKWFPEGALAELPDIEADRSAYDIRRWELAPGDVVFFDFQTVHSSPGFPYDHPRRVVALRYLSEYARHAPRPWATSPDFPGLADELEAGAPMEHPLFPLAWPQAAEA
jgi:ectoine hydroxylase-related dioxygenase (phytanoyl-CoA dioxygenase family)